MGCCETWAPGVRSLWFHPAFRRFLVWRFVGWELGISLTLIVLDVVYILFQFLDVSDSIKRQRSSRGAQAQWSGQIVLLQKMLRMQKASFRRCLDMEPAV